MGAGPVGRSLCVHTWCGRPPCGDELPKCSFCAAGARGPEEAASAVSGGMEGRPQRRDRWADGWGQSSPGGRTGEAPSEASWGLTGAGQQSEGVRRSRRHWSPCLCMAAPNPTEGRLGTPGEHVWGWGLHGRRGRSGESVPAVVAVVAHGGPGSQGRRRGPGTCHSPSRHLHRGDV